MLMLLKSSSSGCYDTKVAYTLRMRAVTASANTEKKHEIENVNNVGWHKLHETLNMIISSVPKYQKQICIQINISEKGKILFKLKDLLRKNSGDVAFLAFICKQQR